MNDFMLPTALFLVADFRIVLKMGILSFVYILEGKLYWAH